MVNAVINIICGNCGSQKVYYELRKHCEPGETPVGETPVNLVCNDCATIHFIDEFNEKQWDIIPKEEQDKWLKQYKIHKDYQER